ncbi:helix-turn-helix transcriptional regulator [Anaerobutyricum hallii]|nr:helix-turn-helix transcriptional regulator [Anaerobutyricum hallii]
MCKEAAVNSGCPWCYHLFNLTNEPKRKTNTSVDIFPQKLKRVMIKRNMKEKELALQTGISVSTIYQYIDGRMLPTIGAFLTKNLL